MNPQKLKAQCEKLWRDRGLLSETNRVVFFETAGKLSWEKGAAVKPTIGKSAAAFIRKCSKHYGPPALPENHEIGKLKPPKWLVENYKRNCPRNWKALVESYGQTRTKYDAPLPGEVWRKGKLIRIDLEQTKYLSGIHYKIKASGAPDDCDTGHRFYPPPPIVRDYRGQYYTLTDWQRFKRRAERAQARQAMHLARSPQAAVARLYSQLRDLFGESVAA